MRLEFFVQFDYVCNGTILDLKKKIAIFLHISLMYKFHKTQKINTLLLISLPRNLVLYYKNILRLKYEEKKMKACTFCIVALFINIIVIIIKFFKNSLFIYPPQCGRSFTVGIRSLSGNIELFSHATAIIAEKINLCVANKRRT